MLIFNKKKNPNAIVLLSAVFALLSIIPPVDAFTVSKNSQQKRLEEILFRNNMIVNGEIVKKKDVSNDDKYELTNITNYMYRMGYLNDMEWFPEESIEEYYSNFKNIYGFEQYYDRGYPGVGKENFISASLEDKEVINIEGFDVLLKISAHSKTNTTEELGEFILSNKNYTMQQKYDEKGNLIITVADDKGIVIEVSTKEFIEELFEKKRNDKLLMNQENLTLEKQNERLKVKILINNINADMYDPENMYVYMDAFVFITTP